jgi:iron complex outermembrane receptor protein
VDAYELGYKYSGERMSFDAATYYYDYTDLQVAYYDGPKSIIENAGGSTIYGADLQARFAVGESFNLNIGAAYIHAEYDSFKNSQIWTQCFVDTFQCPAEYAGIFLSGTEDVSGFEMQRSPEFTGNIGFDYSLELAGGRLGFSGTYYYTSNFYFDSSELYQQDSYDLLSLRADWTNPSEVYTLSIYGDNVTDSEYRTQVLPQAYGGLSMWGAPATVGASVRVNF